MVYSNRRIIGVIPLLDFESLLGLTVLTVGHQESLKVLIFSQAKQITPFWKLWVANWKLEEMYLGFKNEVNEVAIYVH